MMALSPGRIGRSSPEFEFWMVGNGCKSFPQPNLLSADELFSDGVLLPLDQLHINPADEIPDPNAAEKPEPSPSPSGSGIAGDAESARVSASPAPAFSSSKRWKDMFKITGDRRSTGKNNAESCSSKGKEKKKEKKVNGGVSGVNAAELNINIWPFSRSRSAGNGGSRPRVASGSTRKVSSAPCSRSNSSSESKSLNRKWPTSPGRAGVHLGRSSPVWQVRPRSKTSLAAPTESKNVEKLAGKKDTNEVRRKVLPEKFTGGAKGKALTLNVPMCIGYRQQMSCRSDESGSLNAAVDGGDGGGAGEGVRGGNLFNIRSLFSAKRVH